MPVGYHITWNFSGKFFGMPVSGSDADGLLSQNPSARIFSTERFGPEGGLIVTGLIIIIAFFIVDFAKTRYRRCLLPAQSHSLRCDRKAQVGI